MEQSPETYEQQLAALEERRRARRERRKRRWLTAAIIVVAALLLAGLTTYFTVQKGMRNLGSSAVRALPQRPSQEDEDGAVVADDAGASTGRINILVLGSDDSGDGIGRSDTMMLVSFEPKTGEAGVLSIPRDTRVQIPGRSGFHRVNVAHALGGPQLAKRTVATLLNIPVDHYVILDYFAFERFVDVLGGVEVVIDEPMRYDDFAQGLHIDLPAGRHVLNGYEALHYVRYRDRRLGDVARINENPERYDGRISRQLDFVRRAAKKAVSLSSLLKLPGLVQELMAMIQTDITYDEALALAVALRNVQTENIETAVLPGTADTIGGASYWVHDEVRTRIVVNRLLRGEQIVTLQVLNGTGVTGVAGATAEFLRELGYDVVRVANAPDGFNHERTQIIVHNDEASVDNLVRLIDGELVYENGAADAEAQDAARALRTGAGGEADITVIVGQNFSS